MDYKKLFLIVVLLAGSSFAWWNGPIFTRQKNITLTTTSAQTDYQFPIWLDMRNSSDMGKDARFYFINGTTQVPLTFWREEESQSTTGNVTWFWVKVPVVNSTGVTITAYYNSSGMADVSNGKATFDYFTTFSDLSGWAGGTPEGGYLRCGAATAGCYSSPGYSLTSNTLNGHRAVAFYLASGTGQMGTGFGDGVNAWWSTGDQMSSFIGGAGSPSSFVNNIDNGARDFKTFNIAGMVGIGSSQTRWSAASGSTHYAGLRAAGDSVSYGDSYSNDFPTGSTTMYLVIGDSGVGDNKVAWYAAGKFDPGENASYGAEATGTFSPELSTWTARIPITLNSTVATSLTNFTVRVQLNTSDSMYWNAVCTNVRFVDANDNQTLSYNLDSNTSTYCKNSTNNATFWVKIPSLTQNTTIYAMLGNVSTSGEDAQGTWPNNDMVLHGDFSFNTIRNTIQTQSGFDKFGGTTAATIAGKFGEGFYTDGTSNYHGWYPSNYNYGTTAFTITAWAQPTNCAAGKMYLGKWPGSGNVGYIGGYANTNYYHYIGSAAATISGSIACNNADYQHIAVTVNASGNVVGYVNGVSGGTGTRAAAADSVPHLELFMDGNDAYGWVGNIDEMRISNVERSASWIAAEYGQTYSAGALDSNVTYGPSLSVSINPVSNSLNKTITLNYTMTTNGNTVNTTLSIDGVEVANSTDVMANGTYNFTHTANVTYGAHTATVSAIVANNSSISASTSTSFTIYFNVNNTQPANGSTFSTIAATFGYNTTNLYPVQCRLFISGTLMDNTTITSATNYNTVQGLSGTANTWYVSCYGADRPSYTVNTSVWSFTSTASNFTDYYTIWLTPQNVYQTPQALFYDSSGNLNILYYTSNGTDAIQILTLNGSTVTKNYSTPNPRTNNFVTVARLNSSTLILTFDAITNSTLQFINLGPTGGSISINNVTTTYNAQPNSIYDPGTYAYTKQYPTISTNPSSFYIFWLQNATGGSSLIMFNATLNSSGVSPIAAVVNVTPSFGWQTIANSSDLTKWYYAAPKGGGPYTITIYGYNGTAATEIATPDATTYPSANITAAKVFFEEYGNQTYFIQANASVFEIYRINDARNWSQSPGLITLPSNFYFVDKDTFVFFSTESSTFYAYSCYFGNAVANCTKMAAADYGTTVPFIRGTMTTSKRSPSAFTGPNDVVTTGLTVSALNTTRLYYQTYTYDLKMRCFDELNLTRDTMNVRIFSTSNSLSMSSSIYVYGYVMSNSLLGSGTRKVYSFCPSGTNRMYIYDPLVNPALDTFSLVNIAPNAYYTFLLTDCFGQPNRNALVTAKRFLADRQDWTIVEQAYSSVSGDAVLFMQPFATYRLTFLTADGVSLTQDFIPATTATTPVQLSCASQNVNVTPTTPQVYSDLSYQIKATDIYGQIVTNGATNASMNISYTDSSPNGRIYWTNFLLYRTAGDGVRTLIFNETSSSITGDSRNIFVNYTTGEATYDMAMYINTVNLDVNNSNNTMNLSANVNRITVPVFASVRVTEGQAVITGVREHLQSSFKNSGWAWIFLCTILTMLVIGYASRFTLDGAGLIGSLIFIGLALINPASIVVGSNVLEMWVIGVIGFLVAIAIIIWRYV